MHGDDVRVTNARHELGFAHQPQSAFLRRVAADIRPEHLERDLPIELRIVAASTTPMLPAPRVPVTR